MNPELKSRVLLPIGTKHTYNIGLSSGHTYFTIEVKIFIISKEAWSDEVEGILEYTGENILDIYGGKYDIKEICWGKLKCRIDNKSYYYNRNYKNDFFNLITAKLSIRLKHIDDYIFINKIVNG